MSKTQIFIEKARAVHGDRYGYENVVYVRAHDKVIIKCMAHGDFEQIPNNHLKGSGCPKCSGNHRYSTQEWIEKAIAVHGNRYGYERVVYVRSKDNVLINCTKHGYFEQALSDHLKGMGCYKCGKESAAAKKTQKAKDSFIEKAHAVHGCRYDYGRVVYVRACDKVIITCAKHGDFEQTPNGHLSGKGCAKCGFEVMATKRSQEPKDSFIEKARAVHGDRYSYDRVAYGRRKDKVIITCAKHGDFKQSPGSHLNGRGCAKCSGKYNYSTQEWVQEAIGVHGELYDYSKTVYVRAKSKVIIICKEHGDFEQEASSHLMGVGCPSCPARYDHPTNLYLMHNGLGKVKVGYSIDVDVRISQLNSDAPFEAELLETWTLPDTPTVRKIEGKVHRKLAKYHAGLSGFDGATEWFNASPERAKGAILKALIGVEVLGHSEANSLQLALI